MNMFELSHNLNYHHFYFMQQFGQVPVTPVKICVDIVFSKQKPLLCVYKENEWYWGFNPDGSSLSSR